MNTIAQAHAVNTSANTSAATTGHTQRAQQPGWQGIFTPGAAGGPAINMNRTKVRGMQRVFGLLDDSGSMSGAKAAATNVASNDMVAHLATPGFRDGFLVSLITFDDTATVHFNHAKPSDLLGKSTVTGKGGTQMATALREANALRKTWVADPSMHEIAPPVYVVMSDGCSSNRETALREAEAAKREGVTIVTVGFGTDADRAFLEQIASSREHFKFAATPDELKAFFAQVGATLRDSQRTGVAPGAALAQSLRNP